jgi:hypothetical protein
MNNAMARIDSKAATSDGVAKWSSARHLNGLVRGMAVSQMIGVTCEIGLADAVPENGAVSIDVIADQLGVHRTVLSRIARALSRFGVFCVDDKNCISHNECSGFLRMRGAASQYWAARFWTASGVWNAWAHLHHSLYSGDEAFRDTHGEQFFDYMREHPGEADIYREYMAQGYPGRHDAIAKSIVLGPGAVVIDVGGGNGALGRALLRLNPDIDYIVYDQTEPVVGMGDVKVRVGNFFESVPPGGNTYILSWVLHDWPDDKAETILLSCRRAMDCRSRLVIVERVIRSSPADCDQFDLLLDVNMLVLHGGRERTESDFNALLGRSGFAPAKLIDTGPGFSVLETSPLESSS